MSKAAETALEFVASAKKDLFALPPDVRRKIGYALGIAQHGQTPSGAKPLTGLKGASGADVLEIIVDYHTDTYRGVYTVKFEGVIYVLHCFQKKSKSGIGMPLRDENLIIDRLKAAREKYAARNK